MGKFIVLETNKGFTFHLKAGNGECILTSELYNSKASCLNGIQSVKNNAQSAPIEDQTVKDAKSVNHPKFVIFNDKAGKVRFHLTAKNGQIIGASEPYNSKQSCKNGIDSVKRNSDSEVF